MAPTRFARAAGCALGLATALTALALALAPIAGAAFPGRNGRIAYHHSRTVGDAFPPFGPALTQSTIDSVLPNGRRPRKLLGPFNTKRRDVTGPAYSPNGRKLALSFGPWGRPSLYLMRADGRGRLRRLTRSRPGRADVSPAWAPDGRRLAYVRSSAIRVYRAGRSRHIIRQEAADLAWSVRGRIAFDNEPAAASASFEPSIYTMRPDGSHIRQIVERGGDPDWSPKGRWIVYTAPGRMGGLNPSPPDPRLDKTSLALVRSDGSQRRVLTEHDGGREPAFSPDGKYIVFLRFDDASHRNTVVVMRLRDGRTRTIAATPPTGVVPGAPDKYEQHALYSPTWQPLPRRSGR